jgi:hypothetical protein
MMPPPLGERGVCHSTPRLVLRDSVVCVFRFFSGISVFLKHMVYFSILLDLR